MAGRDVSVNLTVNSKGAVSGLDAVADAAKQADKAIDSISDAEIQVATDKALGNVDELRARIKRLSAADQKIVLEADVDRAKQSIANINDRLKDIRSLSDQEIDILLKVRDQASSRIDEVQKDVAKLDSETATVKVDADTSKLDDALGALPGKLGEIGDMFSALGTSGAGIATGVGAGAAAMFELASNAADAAAEVQTIMTLTGTTVENASRLRAALGSVGIEQTDLLDMLGQTNQALTQNTDIARMLGITLGSDVAENFLKAASAAEKISDPVKRANIQSQLFGEEGVRQMAALTAQFGSLEEAMASVSDEQIMTPAQLKAADEMRTNVRNLKTEVSNLSATLGNELVPAVSEVAGALGGLVSGIDTVLGPVGGLKAAIGLAVAPLTNLTDGISTVADGSLGLGDRLRGLGQATIGLAPGVGALAGKFLDVKDKQEEVKKSTGELTGVMEGTSSAAQNVIDHYNQMAAEGQAAAEANEALAKAEQEAADAAKLVAEAAQAAADALQAQVDAAFALGDATLAASNAQNDWAQALESFKEDIKGTEGNLLKMQDVLNDNVGKADQLAQAQVRVAEETAAAAGQTLTATQKMDGYNSAMVKAAGQASGPLRSSILNYIATVNDIPTDVMTLIEAQLDQGDIAGAEKTLNNTSRTRTSAVNADANTAKAESELRQLERGRTTTITVNWRQGSSNVHGPGGGFGTPYGQPRAAAPAAALGPAAMPAAALPWPAEAATAQGLSEGVSPVGASPTATGVRPALSGALRGQSGAAAPTTSVTVFLPVGTNPERTVALIRRYERRNGKTAVH